MNSLRLKKHQLKYIFKFSDRRAGILNKKTESFSSGTETGRGRDGK